MLRTSFVLLKFYKHMHNLCVVVQNIRATSRVSTGFHRNSQAGGHRSWSIDDAHFVFASKIRTMCNRTYCQAMKLFRHVPNLQPLWSEFHIEKATVGPLLMLETQFLLLKFEGNMIEFIAKF